MTKYSLIVIIALSFLCAFYYESQKIKLHPVVNSFLEKISIEKSFITDIDDYSDISYDHDTPEVSEDEVNEYEATIKEDYGIGEITQDFLNSTFNMSSYDEFREYVFSIVFNQKEIPALLECRSKIMNELIRRADFDMDMDEVAEYSLQIVKNYENLAELDGLSVEEYCEQELNISYDEFFDMCYEEGEQEIKTYLVIGAIAGREYKERTEDDIKADYDEEGSADIYWCYQQIENDVYSLFIHVDDNY